MIYELIVENICSGERQSFNFNTKDETNFEVFCKAMNSLVALNFNLAGWVLISFEEIKINKNKQMLEKLLEGKVAIFDFISLSDFIKDFPKELNTLSIQYLTDGLYYAIADELSIRAYKFYKETRENE